MSALEQARAQVAREGATFTPGDAFEGDAPGGDDPDTGRAAPPPPPRQRFEFLDAVDFLKADYRPTWLIPRVLVKGQPGVIAGPSKGMKTSVLIDLAVSLAAGRPFLGHFPIPTPARVAVVSGESGGHTLQETTRRVMAARGIGAADFGDRLKLSFDLPQLADVEQMAEFADRLVGFGAELVVIDPLYLCLGGEIDHANLFQMGAAFRVVAEVLREAGVTPVLVHHANRGLKTGDPMEITHLAYSGLEQFARQFVMLNRQSAYKGDGVHDLWMSAGGSAGHGGLWSLRIAEGVVDEHFGGRRWDVEVRTPGEVQTGKAASKKDTAVRRVRAEETEMLTAIDKAMEKGQPVASRSAVRKLTGFSDDKVKRVAAGLIEDGHLEVFTGQVRGGKGATQTVKGYRRPSVVTGVGQPIHTPDPTCRPTTTAAPPTTDNRSHRRNQP